MVYDSGQVPILHDFLSREPLSPPALPSGLSPCQIEQHPHNKAPALGLLVNEPNLNLVFRILHFVKA